LNIFEVAKLKASRVFKIETEVCPLTQQSFIVPQRRPFLVEYMAWKMHNIAEYTYFFGTKTGGPQGIYLKSDSGPVAVIYLLPEGSALPACDPWPDLTGADLYFHERQLSPIIDMLRNEKPVYLLVTDSPNAWISTGAEPIGEEELH
jgi:hypothetical protein